MFYWQCWSFVTWKNNWIKLKHWKNGVKNVIFGLIFEVIKNHPKFIKKFKSSLNN